MNSFKPTISFSYKYFAETVGHANVKESSQVGGNVTNITGACATHTFAYLVRGPWLSRRKEGILMSIKKIINQKWIDSHCRYSGWLIASVSHYDITEVLNSLLQMFSPFSRWAITRWAIGGRWLQSPASQYGDGGKPDSRWDRFWSCCRTWIVATFGMRIGIG